MLKYLLLFCSLILIACGGSPVPGEGAADSVEQGVEHRVTMVVKIGTTVPFPGYNHNTVSLLPDPSDRSGLVGLSVSHTTSGPDHGGYDLSLHRAYLAVQDSEQDTLVQDIDTPGVKTFVTFSYLDGPTDQRSTSGGKYSTAPLP